jgi:hypothetical protein
LLIALNIAAEARKWEWPTRGRILMSTDPRRSDNALELTSILLQNVKAYHRASTDVARHL